MINLTNKEIENFEYGNNAMKFNGGSVIINSIDMDNRSERYGLGVVVV